MESGKNKAGILELEHIKKSFGITQALKDASLTIYPGEVHTLMGGNGAGKSTMIGIIGGAKQHDEGIIRLYGEEVVFNNPRESIHKGIAVVYQELSVLPHLTVAENITLTNPEVSNSGRYNWKRAEEIALQALSHLGGSAAEISPSETVSNLRADQCQMVEIARAVNMGAKIILLDEPTSSLNYEETESLFMVVRELCSKDIAFIFVSHRLKEVREITHRVTVIRDGMTIRNGIPIDEVTDNTLITEMLGKSTEIDADRGHVKGFYENAHNQQSALVISHPESHHRIEIKKGEIVGIAGLAGSGRSALLRSVWGDNPWPELSFELNGEEYTPVSPKDAMEKGVAYIGEDRRISGLFIDLPLGETLMPPARILNAVTTVGNSELKTIEKILKVLQVKTPEIDSFPGALSGGNQQKLLFGKWLTLNPVLFLLDEPTRGVDVGTKAEIYKLIIDLAECGTGIVIVSSETPELVTLAHKVIVMNKGKPEHVLYDEDITEDSILTAIAEVC